MHWTQLLLQVAMVLLVVTNLTLLGSSRMAVCIRAASLQGVLLGLFPMWGRLDHLDLRMLLLMAVTITIKGLVFPTLLLRALRTSGARREVEPFISHAHSILLGLGGLLFAIWLGRRLPLPIPAETPLIVPVALFTFLVGLMLIITRRKALTQALGYLVFENGIFIFGTALVGEIPVVVELGVLLDAFVAIFMMTLAIHSISREFDHIDVDRLRSLRG